MVGGEGMARGPVGSSRVPPNWGNLQLRETAAPFPAETRAAPWVQEHKASPSPSAGFPTGWWEKPRDGSDGASPHACLGLCWVPRDSSLPLGWDHCSHRPGPEGSGSSACPRLLMRAAKGWGSGDSTGVLLR